MSNYDSKTLGIVVVVALFAGAISGVITGLLIAPETEETLKGSNVTFTLSTTLLGGFVGVGGDIQGIKNPVLEVNEGDTVTINIIGAEPSLHDIGIDEFNAKSGLVARKEKSSITFVASRAGEYAYYCTVDGHRAAGMVGKLVVGTPFKPEPAKVVDVNSVLRNASDVGTPIFPRNTTTVIEFTLIAKEVTAYIETDVTFTFWTYNDTVAGPLMRVMLGDTVIVTLINDPSSTQQHSIDLHAVTGPGGGAGNNTGDGTLAGGANGILRAEVGESSKLTFVAGHEGAFVYHCASPHIPTHISKGMFGSIIVEPVGGLPLVDKEFYLGQHEIYTKFPPGTPGHNVYDSEAEFHEDPNYVLFNGAVFGLTGENALQANQNDEIRIFFAVGGPNLISSFHIIGEILDKVYYETTGDPMINAETVLVAPGSVIMVELTVENLGDYLLVDHALSRVFLKGALAVLTVT